MSDDGIDVHALLASAELIGISTVELSARRRQTDVVDAESTVDPDYSLLVDARSDLTGFRVVLQTAITASIGEIQCDVQAEYLIGALKMDQIPRDVLQEFINNVALMTVLPFVRQGIADITLRVFEAPLLMPIIQRGEITFPLGDSAGLERTS